MSNYDDFEQYLRQAEPGKRLRGAAWATAIGLQQVDGLTTSDYLKSVAVRNIEGEISIDHARDLIDTYYQSKENRDIDAVNSEEADKVSANIAKLLGEQAFVFSPMAWLSIHRRIFQGVFSHAGEIRDYNITKKEWVLDGDSVLYAPASEIMASLEYDFSQERNIKYGALDIDGIIKNIARFISGIWQIHPFREGNTRSTAVLLIKYLRSLGYDIDNTPFVENSWFFRNALVRANVQNPTKGIEKTDKFLIMFINNLLKGENNELKNRIMHVRYAAPSGDQATKRPSDRAAIIANILAEHPKSRNEIMKELGLSHIPSFRKNYLLPALEAGIIELTIPEKPTDSRQQYRLTSKGKKLLRHE